MGRLFRIRIVGLLLLTTGVCLGSYFYAKRDYTVVRYRNAWQKLNQNRTSDLESLLLARPSGPKPAVAGTIIAFDHVQVREVAVDYDQIRTDAAIAGLVLTALYGVVVVMNRIRGGFGARRRF